MVEGEVRWEHFVRSGHVASSQAGSTDTRQPPCPAPHDRHHHTSEVRPEADVIALQQFVHNLFHHRNIPSGWAERQKKRVLVIPSATGPAGRGAGWAALPEHPSCPTAPKRLCYKHPSHGHSLPISFLTCIFFPWRSSWHLHTIPAGLLGVLSCPWGWHRSLNRYFGSSSASHSDSWALQTPSPHAPACCVPASQRSHQAGTPSARAPLTTHAPPRHQCAHAGCLAAPCP